MIKNEDGCPVFALVNKATGDAIRGSVRDGRSINSVPYNPFYLDFSVLWTMSWDMGHGFRCIQLVENISLNFDAFYGDDRNIVLSDWREGDELQWKIVPWCLVVEDLKLHELEERVSKGSEVEDGEKQQGAVEKTDGAELPPLEMLKLRLG